MSWRGKAYVVITGGIEDNSIKTETIEQFYAYRLIKIFEFWKQSFTEPFRYPISCSNMDGPTDYHAKWNKLEKDKYI